MATDQEKLELLLRQKTLTDVVLSGYLLFLSTKNLLAEAETYVKGYLKTCFQEEEMKTVFEQKKAFFEKEVVEYDNRRGSK